jgi:nucleoside-diphosphate-sugar epimerase
MGNSKSKVKVAIVGAAGFVGIELVNQLQFVDEFEVFAVTRDNGSFLLGDKKVCLLKLEEVNKLGPFDFVINLAYPTSLEPHFYPEVNLQILDTIKSLVSIDTKIIQVSTQAVFGYAMDKAVSINRVKEHRDFAYIETKIEMENLLHKAFPTNDLSIVRLGNVIGAGSGGWTASVLNRLLFGKYVGVEGVNGYGNMTDVVNVADYLIFLMKNMPSGKNIFHLAEFSNVKWNYVVSLMAGELKVQPLLSDKMPNIGNSLKQEVKQTIDFPSYGNIYRKLMAHRIGGSYLRSLVRVMGRGQFSKVKKGELRCLPATASLDSGDVTFLTVITAEKEFKSVVLANWQPQFSFEQSWQNVRKWMSDVGYL